MALHDISVMPAALCWLNTQQLCPPRLLVLDNQAPAGLYGSHFAE